MVSGTTMTPAAGRLAGVRFIFPRTTNFREERPRLCWEHMYGWMEGYGVLFDPVVHAALGCVPEWANGWEGDKRPGEFIITACAQASEAVQDMERPGLYIRPPGAVGSGERGRLSEKEQLVTPVGTYYYPFNALYDRYGAGASAWQLGGNRALVKQRQALAVGFELFAMFGSMRSEAPQRCFVECADVVVALLGELGIAAGPSRVDGWRGEIRIDFQAYGLNRLLVQWFLEMNAVDRAAVDVADRSYRLAVAAWQAGDETAVTRHLGAAFDALARLRASRSPLEVRFIECPHLGILFRDLGFFELEWPQYSRDNLLSLLDQTERHGYKMGLEAGASCWRNFTDRYPELRDRMVDLVRRGNIELLNGTFSLPYALMSPLSLQYWQFKLGRRVFEEVFGVAPVTYACQENSLTPQMPELLRHFGYRQALHITQNRGEAPADTVDFIQWTSPAGQGVPALTAPRPELTRKGNNYFFDLPMVHRELGPKQNSLNYVNLQDMGYVPFRLQMIRAHRYAPVWGRFVLASEVFKDAPASPLPPRTYTADAYAFSRSFFYPNETNANAFSHYEAVFALSRMRRQLLLAAHAAGRLAPLYEPTARSLETLCLLEAHDCCVVQGQRRGEFHARHTLACPPYSRATLAQTVAKLVAEATADLSAQAGRLCPGGAARLFNAAEVPLAFGRVRHPEAFSGTGLVTQGAHAYAAGAFEAFAAAPPLAPGAPSEAALPYADGNWALCTDPAGLGIRCGTQQVSLAVVDRRHGRFEHVRTTVRTLRWLTIAESLWMRKTPELQSVVTTTVFSPVGEYCEVSVAYAPRQSFDAVAKWDDYLAVEVSLAAPLGDVVRFNPNVRSITAEDRVISPFVLDVATGRGPALSFLNEGAAAYELDRANGRVRWIFHVACESVHERRMAVAFDSRQAFQLSRAWSQGLLPLEAVADGFLAERNWDGISVEDVIAPDTLLVSNLRDTVHEMALGAGASGACLGPEAPVQRSHLRLEPFGIGLIQLDPRPES